MSEISLILVLLLKTNKTLNDMAKVQIKSEKLTPFGGIFSIMEQFDALLAQKHVLNIYSDNNAYANLFKTDFG